MSVAIAFFNDPDANLTAARAFPLSYSFLSQSTFKVKLDLAGIGLATCAMVYIDNADSPTTTTITISGTGQRIVAPAYSQGFYRVLNSPLDIDFLVSNSSAAAITVNLLWINIAPCEPHVWKVL